MGALAMIVTVSEWSMGASEDDGEWRTENEEWRVEDGKWRMGQ